VARLFSGFLIFVEREKGEFNKKSTFLNVRQRKNLRLVHSAWEVFVDEFLPTKREAKGVAR
jgi:hypothetical protein